MKNKYEIYLTRTHIRDLYGILFQDNLSKLFELSEMEALIVEKKWLENKKLAEIGEEVGLSDSRVGQIYNKIVKRLKHKMLIIAETCKKYKEVTEEKIKLKEEVRLLTKKIKKFNLEELKISNPSFYAVFTDPVYNSPVRQMDLSARTMHCLLGGDVNTLGEIMDYTSKDLLSFRGMGKKSIAELENYLKEHFNLELKK
jgi:DNA-directed RNA polymerase subunit alpha